MNYLVLLSLICYVPMHAWFEHGRAVEAAHKNDWQHAHALLTTELINHPENPSVVYDAGVAAYKIGDHEQARAYFKHVTELSNTSDTLKERAFFNLGNTYVALKNLEDAVASYQQALQIDPQDARAQHNLDIVKKMLEEQKQKDEEPSCAKAPADKQKKEEKQDQQQQDKEQQQQSEEQSDSEGESERESEAGSDSKQSEPQEKKESEKKKREQQEREQKQQDAQKQTDKQKEKEEKQYAREAEKNKHEAKESEKTGEQQQAELEAKLDKKLLHLLEQQEKHDADINKQMIKATVSSQMGDKHDKQCW